MIKKLPLSSTTECAEKYIANAEVIIFNATLLSDNKSHNAFDCLIKD
jgi:hypothetical protein